MAQCINACDEKKKRAAEHCKMPLNFYGDLPVVMLAPLGVISMLKEKLLCHR